MDSYTPEQVMELLTKLRGPAPERLIGLPEVRAKVGLSQTTIEKMVSAGTFPAPRKVGIRAIAWLESELDAWIKQLPATGYNPGSRSQANAANGKQEQPLS